MSAFALTALSPGCVHAISSYRDSGNLRSEHLMAKKAKAKKTKRLTAKKPKKAITKKAA